MKEPRSTVIPALIALYDKRLRRLGRQMRRAGLAPGARGFGSIAGSYVKRIPNFFGKLTVVEVPKGRAWVEINTVNGPTAHICNLWTRQARRKGASLVWRASDEPKCEVDLTFKGRTVHTEASRACRAFCGANGYFEDITYTRTGHQDRAPGPGADPFASSACPAGPVSQRQRSQRGDDAQ